ncbi:MAG: hypothetical protein CMN31_00130, partial [Sandaracinus sp.]|nr:hypothetical protein [Sandaracinus sp.]
KEDEGTLTWRVVLEQIRPFPVLQTRRAWLFLMVIGAPLTLPVYWAKHVWSPPYRRTGRPRRVVETG